MQITAGAQALDAVQTPLLVVPVFADEGAPGPAFAALDAATGGHAARVMEEESYQAKRGKTLLYRAPDEAAFRRVLLVGMGKAGDLKPADTRALGVSAVQAANGRKLTGVACVLPQGADAVDAIAAARFVTEGLELGAYRYDKWRTKDVEPQTCEAVTLVADEDADLDALGAIVRRTQAATAGVCFARDLMNGPPVEVTPTFLAEAATEMAQAGGLEIEVIEADDMRRAGMNLLLAVSAGSRQAPKLIHLTYRPANAAQGAPSVAFVGKGITFDAGGYNLKPTGHIEDMKLDMGGGAAVLGAMKAMSTWAPGYVVHGIVPAAENLVSEAAYKPGDVYKAMNGKTVEIMNTDAEGRLILADALSYAVELGVDRIVDLATLTGACVVALGPHTAGIFSNNEAFSGRVKAAADAAGEDMWVMPMTPKLKKMLKSPVADMKNVGERWGGAITAAQFLSEFVGKTTWVHLDIAGPAMADSADGYISRGGTGFGVLSLLQLVDGEV